MIQILLAIGTDDGLIQITEDGGASWRKVTGIAGAPKQSYVNSVYLSKHDVNVIYAAFNHHKYGDFKPYLFKSGDKGKTWTSISANLPKKGSVYAIEEDHKDSGLIFCGTEYGVFFSPNKGQHWKQLSSGLPTIAVRDIAIQERENDLVLGTFGRGFYVMDDYSALRSIENESPADKAIIYPIRDALSWEKSLPLGLPKKAFQGDNFYSAPNLDPEALITYYYNDSYKSLKEIRIEKEKELVKNRKDAAYPDYNALKAEMDEEEPSLVFTIRNDKGQIVKKEFKKPKEGLQRFEWNLRYTLQNPIDLRTSTFYNPWESIDEGTLVEPGSYTVSMELYRAGELSQLAGPVSFKVIGLDNTVMPADDRAEKVAFQKQVMQLDADLATCRKIMDESKNKLKYIKSAIERSELPYADLSKTVMDIEHKLDEVSVSLYGDPVKTKLDISQVQNPATRVGKMSYEQKYSTSSPTKTHRDSYSIAKDQISVLKQKAESIYNVDIKQLEGKLIESGAPYTPGRGYENED